MIQISSRKNILKRDTRNEKDARNTHNARSKRMAVVISDGVPIERKREENERRRKNKKRSS